MASQVSIAIDRDSAIARIDSILAENAQTAGVEYAPLPLQGKDQNIVIKNQLVHIADALEAILGKAERVDAVDGSEADTEPVTDTPKRAQKTTDDTPVRAKSGSAKGAK
jgi:hypothetical protein